MNATSTQQSQRPFVITRILVAPRELVWKCWTEREHMQWWGPKGVTSDYKRLELWPGGICHYCMRTPDGHEMWGKWVVREVTKTARLVFVNSFSDAAGGLTRHPMNPNWPLEMLSTVTFEAQGNKTLLSIQWLPVNATDVERKTFDDSHASMQGGWSGSLDQLEAYLASQLEAQ
jgi:uncharacterized protein YndB with AHSA1/START domain